MQGSFSIDDSSAQTTVSPVWWKQKRTLLIGTACLIVCTIIAVIIATTHQQDGPSSGPSWQCMQAPKVNLLAASGYEQRVAIHVWNTSELGVGNHSSSFSGDRVWSHRQLLSKRSQDRRLTNTDPETPDSLGVLLTTRWAREQRAGEQQKVYDRFKTGIDSTGKTAVSVAKMIKGKKATVNEVGETLEAVAPLVGLIPPPAGIIASGALSITGGLMGAFGDGPPDMVQLKLDAILKGLERGFTSLSNQMENGFDLLKGQISRLQDTLNAIGVFTYEIYRWENLGEKDLTNIDKGFEWSMNLIKAITDEKHPDKQRGQLQDLATKFKTYDQDGNFMMNLDRARRYLDSFIPPEGYDQEPQGQGGKSIFLAALRYQGYVATRFKLYYMQNNYDLLTKCGSSRGPIIADNLHKDLKGYNDTIVDFDQGGGKGLAEAVAMPDYDLAACYDADNLRRTLIINFKTCMLNEACGDSEYFSKDKCKNHCFLKSFGDQGRSGLEERCTRMIVLATRCGKVGLKMWEEGATQFGYTLCGIQDWIHGVTTNSGFVTSTSVSLVSGLPAFGRSSSSWRYQPIFDHLVAYVYGRSLTEFGHLVCLAVSDLDGRLYEEKCNFDKHSSTNQTFSFEAHTATGEGLNSRMQYQIKWKGHYLKVDAHCDVACGCFWGCSGTIDSFVGSLNIDKPFTNMDKQFQSCGIGGMYQPLGICFPR